MPYKLNGNCVVKDDGSSVPGGCHDTHEQAVAHLRALYANVKDAKTKDVSATASPYGLHGPNSLLGIEGMGGTGRKRDKKEMKMADSEGHSGFLVEADGEQHLPTRKNGKLDHGLMGAAWAALHSGYRGHTYQGPNKAEAIRKLTALYHSENMPTPDQETTRTKAFDPAHSFHVFPMPDGTHRWVMTTSSGFRDRDGETIPTAFLAADSARMKETRNYGPLRWHHIGSEHANPLTRDPGKGLDIGDCDYSEMHDHSQIESGTFRDNRIGAVLAAHTKELGGSKGYFYARADPDANGVYQRPIWGFERSVLPRESASNWMATAIKSLFHKEASVNLDAVAKLKSLLGKDHEKLVDDILAGNTAKESTLADAGVAVKAAKEDMKKEMEDEEKKETPEDEKKESPEHQAMEEKMGVEKHKTKEFDPDAFADALVARMKETFLTPAQLDAKLSELSATATKAASDQKTALDALDARMKALEGDTPTTKKGFKASEQAGTDLMESILRSVAKEQGLNLDNLTAIGGKNQQPVSDMDRITDRMMNAIKVEGVNPIA